MKKTIRGDGRGGISEVTGDDLAILRVLIKETPFCFQVLLLKLFFLFFLCYFIFYQNIF